MPVPLFTQSAIFGFSYSLLCQRGQISVVRSVSPGAIFRHKHLVLSPTDRLFLLCVSLIPLVPHLSLVYYPLFKSFGACACTHNQSRACSTFLGTYYASHLSLQTTGRRATKFPRGKPEIVACIFSEAVFTNQR